MAQQARGSMHHSDRRAGRALAAVAVAIALTSSAGCSKKASAPEPAPETTAATTEAPGTTAPGTTSRAPKEATGTTFARGTTSTRKSTTDTRAPDAAQYATFCQRLREVATEVNDAPVDQGLDQYFAMLRERFAELASIAPDPIRADFELVARELTRYDPTDPDAIPPEMNEVFERISAWSIANCGFDPDEIGEP